jgi:pullulanase, type I
MHPDSGIKNKGKFLGLSEENTRTSKGISTGLSHIKELGVTHVQIMPMFDFSWMSIDEKNPYKYNWGYDPLNYNVPEGSYSTDPYFAICRIHELKKMIQLLHRNNICVVMDVVYNHLYSLMENNFNKVFPGYYFRYDNEGNPSDGSGCGNDTASERPMMRKFIIDSVKYWATEYHLDGFRFDLMGLHDITTINTIREELNKISKSIMVYGEGWVLNTMLSNDKRANINNTDLLPTIGLFNDVIRDNLKGSVFFSSDRGFINGKDILESVIRYCVTGCTYNMDINSRGMFLSPKKTINYVACHDNYTLWDKLQLTNNDYNVEDMKAIYKMADSIILTSQGIPFIFSGAEFCRTKNGISNSYNSTDAINRIDWHRKSLFIDIFEYYKGMIELRKAHPAFRMDSVQDIKAHMYFLRDVPKNCVAFILKDHANDDIWKDILVIYNANRYDLKVKVPNDTWYVVVNKYISGNEILDSVEGNELPVQGLSVNVFFNA